MGTRSLTTVLEGRKEIVCMYRQMDGYPTGHGQDLIDMFGAMRLCNGIGSDQLQGQWANGIHCFAAQLVAGFKDGIGNIYLYAPKTRDRGEEWIYTLYQNKGEDFLSMKVYAGAVTFFGLPGTKQDTMPCLYTGPLKDFDAGRCEKLREGMEIAADALAEKVTP